MAGEKNLTDKRPAGALLGQSASDLVGFWGKAPVAQPVLTYINTATATTTLNEQQINRIIAALVLCGIIRTT